MEGGGEPKKQGRRSDLEDCKKIIDNSVDDAMGTMQQIADTHFGDFVRYYRGFAKYADLVDIKRAKQREPHMPEVIVYLGRAGSGKSYHCYHDEGYQQWISVPCTDGIQDLLRRLRRREDHLVRRVQRTSHVLHSLHSDCGPMGKPSGDQGRI